MEFITFSVLFILIVNVILLLFLYHKTHKIAIDSSLRKKTEDVVSKHVNSIIELQQSTQIHQDKKNTEQFNMTITTLQQSIKVGMDDIRKQLQTTLEQHGQYVEKQLLNLTKTTESKLHDITNQVDKRLHQGFEQTNQVFQNVIKRLTIIDEAQKEIIKLSGDVVSLQDILNDKRTRGAFGEVQLNALIKNLVPESNFTLQATLSNGKRVDCLLKLPEPTGNVAIDSKFPLEYYKNMLNHKDENIASNAQSLFKQSVKKHIDDIASKYIIPNETADGSILFIPAEAIFAEIHANFYDLVEYSQKKKVCLLRQQQ